MHGQSICIDSLWFYWVGNMCSTWVGTCSVTLKTVSDTADDISARRWELYSPLDCQLCAGCEERESPLFLLRAARGEPDRLLFFLRLFCWFHIYVTALPAKYINQTFYILPKNDNMKYAIYEIYAKYEIKQITKENLINFLVLLWLNFGKP